MARSFSLLFLSLLFLLFCVSSFSARSVHVSVSVDVDSSVSDLAALNLHNLPANDYYHQKSDNEDGNVEVNAATPMQPRPQRRSTGAKKPGAAADDDDVPAGQIRRGGVIGQSNVADRSAAIAAYRRSLVAKSVRRPANERRPITGATAPLPEFNANLPTAAAAALKKYRMGLQGASVKNVGSLIAGRSVQDVDSIIGQLGKGWKPAGNPGISKSTNLKWTRIDGQGTAPDGSKFRQLFYVNEDGGVVRVKPDGMPGSKAPGMDKPHAAVYVMADKSIPLDKGGLDFANEAFKISEGIPSPKWPRDMQAPEGITIENGNPEFESYLKSTNWAPSTHIKLSQ